VSPRTQQRDDLYESGISVVVRDKLDRIKRCFPTVDETTLKLVFYELGDHLDEAIHVLRDMFPTEYHSGASSTPLKPKVSSPVKRPQVIPTPEIRVVRSRAAPGGADYESKLEDLEHSRHLMCLLFQAASIAAGAGNMQRAKELSLEGKKHQEIFKQLSEQTTDETYRRTNRHNDAHKIDLHGLRVGAALGILDARFEAIKQQMTRAGVRAQHVEVVTGKGLHSVNRVAKIKPAVAKYLSEKAYSFRENEGSLSVYLTAS
jgi:hypothetical protein